jgi:hypothetical protein
VPRTPWTEVETQALIEGIRVHGVIKNGRLTGNWSMILKDDRFRVALKDRDGGNLKDRYRNLVDKNLF